MIRVGLHLNNYQLGSDLGLVCAYRTFEYIHVDKKSVCEAK